MTLYRPCARTLPWALATTVSLSCTTDPSPDGQADTTGSGPSATDAGLSTTASRPDASEGADDAEDDDPTMSSSADASEDSTAGSDAADTDPSSDSGESTETGSPSGTVYSETFDGMDGDPWPRPWVQAGTGIVESQLASGRARMTGQETTVGRMVAPGFDEQDVDATISVTFDNLPAQGFGFYVRQNGGSLQRTEPAGQGYAVFIEGNGQAAIGLWRETNGVEELLVETGSPFEAGIKFGIPYRVRFSCEQVGSETQLRTKIWPEGDDEPDAWQLELVDATPELQNIGGGFAVDVYNYRGTAGVEIDDMVVERL